MEMNKLTIDRAKSNLRKFWTSGCGSPDFQTLCDQHGHTSVIGKRDWRLQMQSVFGYDNDTAKQKTKTVLKNLAKYGLGRCIETVEGKQFVFNTVIVGHDIEFVMTASILHNWLDDLIVDLEIEKVIERTKTDLDAGINTLAFVIGNDLENVLEDEYLSYVHDKYGVILSKYYPDLKTFAQVVATKIIEEQVRQKLICLIGN